jgi:hypothetical protein
VGLAFTVVTFGVAVDIGTATLAFGVAAATVETDYVNIIARSVAGCRFWIVRLGPGRLYQVGPGDSHPQAPHMTTPRQAQLVRSESRQPVLEVVTRFVTVGSHLHQAMIPVRETKRQRYF